MGPICLCRCACVSLSLSSTCIAAIHLFETCVCFCVMCRFIHSSSSRCGDLILTHFGGACLKIFDVKGNPTSLIHWHSLPKINSQGWHEEKICLSFLTSTASPRKQHDFSPHRYHGHPQADIHSMVADHVAKWLMNVKQNLKWHIRSTVREIVLPRLGKKLAILLHEH